LQMTGSGFLGLISRGSANVTIVIENWFRRTAQHIGSIPALAERFISDSPKQIASSLPSELRAEIDSFLHRYGFRSRHRTLLFKRWAEAPEEVVGILQSLVRHPQGTEAALKGTRHNLRGPSPGGVFAPALWLLAGMARRFLDLREELRFLLDKVLYRIRCDLLALGTLTGLGDAIFFMKPPEIEKMALGQMEQPEAAHLAFQRRRRFLNPVEPSTFWVDGRPEFDFCAGGTLLRGIGTSPGHATGRAVIVADPGADKIRRGDIVVARHTDPGWTPIFSLIGGIVMEEGGLLNHCSIVARELGVPSIVGVSRATRLIPEGARVTIDGGAGVVRVEEG
jgi:rifampicin phosphotransferase